jgi:predicted O-methyltransferase YrrM
VFDLTHLKPASQLDLAALFGDPTLEAAWRLVEPTLGAFELPDKTGGVNPGDRRAIFYVTLHLRARSMLEVGTHIGASTIHAAAALRAVDPSAAYKLDTVDILDVNASTRPWLHYGAALSPREMIMQLGLDSSVRFVVESSLSYLTKCSQAYDLIFLDGDHSEDVVYREIAAALRLLTPGGVILLHDYFPNERPLWFDGGAIVGPARAVRKMQQEGVAVRDMPFGALPWPTKLESSVTSLALLARDS